MDMTILKYQSFLKTLQITRPVIQAPMAGVTSPRMVAEVCKSGALGSLPVSHLNFNESSGIANLRNLIKEVEFYTKNSSICRNINLNFFCNEPVFDITSHQKEDWFSLHEKVSNISIDRNEISFKERSISFKEYEDGKAFQELLSFFKNEFRPKVISFHFGHPTEDSIGALHELGILVFATATSEEEYQLLKKLKVDGVVCQGYEAGGHRGNFLQLDERFDEKLSTLCLVKKVLHLRKSEQGDGPFVIPAGGLSTPEDLKCMLEIGASAIQIGTPFLGTLECMVSENFIKVAHSGKAEPTLMTSIVSGKCARAISSPFLRRLQSSYAGQSLPDYGFMYPAYKRLRALHPDKLNFMLAGQVYPLVKTNISVRELLCYISDGLDS